MKKRTEKSKPCEREESSRQSHNPYRQPDTKNNLKSRAVPDFNFQYLAGFTSSNPAGAGAGFGRKIRALA